jgi:hypothetical protein
MSRRRSLHTPPRIGACVAVQPLPAACSKAGHRVAVLAKEALGVPVEADSPRLFCSLIPPNEKKVAALRCAM